MSEARLIERWLPIAAIGEESVRERRALSALPAPYYLHVWWARRPLIASRAAVLASLLPASTSEKDFLRLIRIDGDPIVARKQIDKAKKTGIRVDDPYGYPRAFSCAPDVEDVFNKAVSKDAKVLDPTAGGGSIPFESLRLGFRTYANDLNSVAATVLAATVDYPVRLGNELTGAFQALAKRFINLTAAELRPVFPQVGGDAEVVTSYVWARGGRCPYCSGEIPIAPNWKLEPSGIGMRLVPECAGGPGDASRKCNFEIVHEAGDQSPGTVAGTSVVCPFPDCKRIVDLSAIKEQGEASGLSEVLCAVVVKKQVLKTSKAGKEKTAWQRQYRAPQRGDDVSELVESILLEKMPLWEAEDIIPNELLPIDTESWSHGNTPHQYGAKKFSDLFSRRQLLVHGVSVECFQKLLKDAEADGPLSELQKATFVYLALAIDKLVDWNSLQCTWDLDKLRMAHTFQVHAFPIRWSFAEMDVLAKDLGYQWVVRQTSRCIAELLKLTNNHDSLFSNESARLTPATVSSKSGEAVTHIADGSIDAVVVDPPYGANVMYAELSDFFYVWLKRTAGLVVPDLFTRQLTDKDAEAVANKARFKGKKGAAAFANREYQERMAAIFEECRRVLKTDGIMTVMFTHKDAGAWDALTKSLMSAHFFVTASWPVNTEAEASTHIKNKAAANSTIFLVCRPRPKAGGDVTYWEDVEPLVSKAVRSRVPQFQEAGIVGVDLYLACFGPALEEFSKHWPLLRGTPRPEPVAKRRRKQAELFEEEFDPYAVTPEDALEAARREVKTWRLNQLMHVRGKSDLDTATSFFVLAWDAFKSPTFAYDEALRLARAVGADLEHLIGRICEKKGSDIKLWDSATRSSKGALGASDGARGMIDALHYAAHLVRTKSVAVARDYIVSASLADDPMFLNALEATLEILPPSKTFAKVDFSGDLKLASDDFDALEKLRRLAFADAIDEPKQLKLWAEEAA
ncbi:DUF1156 domain-containing protein [Bradyrhizobium ottawaense]|uniref:DUF1156 domain-containing protein n=1 Tax=Bradyrhizobium ottawaense TaxID=931866 RepID=UPI00339959B0